MARTSRIELLHPIARAQFLATQNALRKAPFTLNGKRYVLDLFETFRSPVDQLVVFEAKTSKARPWASAHQFGLAADYVPRLELGSGWTWPDASHECWDLLSRTAKAHGLLQPIGWDRPHIEHPAWLRVRNALVPLAA